MPKMRQKSLLILSFSTLTSDARLLKQIDLFSTQYRVTTCGYGPTPEGVEKHIQIPDTCVYWRRDRAALLTRRYRKAYWSSPAVQFAFDALQGEQFDGILANDVDTAGLAVALKPTHGFHADLHEYSPREAEQKCWWRTFIAPYVRWQIRKFVTQACSVTTVGPRIAEEYNKRFGLSAKVVENAAPYWDLPPSPVGSPLRFVHSGAGRPDRYIELLIEAFALTSKPITLDLYLAGGDPAYMRELRELAEGAGKVRILPPKDYADLIPTLNGYDAGIHVLPPVNFNHKWALPNKLFDYIQARLALLVGPSPEMARLVRHNDIGVVSESFSAAELARTLDSLERGDVARFKASANEKARALAAETAVLGWDEAVRDLLR